MNGVIHLLAFPEGRLTRGASGWRFTTVDGITGHSTYQTVEDAYRALLDAPTN